MIKRIALTVTCLVLMGLHTSLSQSQNHAGQSIRFRTEPAGATVTLNGETVGQTPLDLSLPTGQYEVIFRLPGFNTWQQTYLITGETSFIHTVLTLTDSFIPFSSYAYRKIKWLSDSNTIMLQNSAQELWAYDAETTASYPVNIPPYLLTSEALQVQLGISPLTGSGDTIASLAFVSPSGRYIAYGKPPVERHLPYQTGQLALFDAETQTSIPVDIVLPNALINSFVDLPFQVNWSPNELYMHVSKSNLPYGCDTFVLLHTTPPTTLDCLNVTTDTSERVLLQSALQPPSNTGLVLALETQDNQHPEPRLWLVNMNTLTAQIIPVDGVLGAAFNRDETMIYVAHRAGISRTPVDDLQAIELFTEDVSARWGVDSVIFSSTAEYALIHAYQENIFEITALYSVPQE